MEVTDLAEISQDDRTMAMLAHLSCFVLPITGPLILFLAFLPWIGGIMWGLKANQGEWTGYPLIDNIGRPEGI